MESRVRPLLRPYLSLSIVLPPKEDVEYGKLADMVRIVNDTQVDIEEQLSFHVYVYSRDEETLKIVA